MIKIIRKGDVLLLACFVSAAVFIAFWPFIRSAGRVGVFGIGGSAAAQASPADANAPQNARQPDRAGSAATGATGDTASDSLLVVVSLDNKTYGVYPLDEDRTVDIENGGNSNVLEIRDSGATMLSASCDNQICVHTGTITRPGESIICLPNRVIVEIRSPGASGGFDAIAK